MRRVAVMLIGSVLRDITERKKKLSQQNVTDTSKGILHKATPPPLPGKVLTPRADFTSASSQGGTPAIKKYPLDGDLSYFTNYGHSGYRTMTADTLSEVFIKGLDFCQTKDHSCMPSKIVFRER
jgi:hypothetical protein